MNDNDRLVTETQDLNTEIESTQSQNIDNRRSSTIIQDKNVEIGTTVSQNENIETVSTLSQYSDEPLSINSKKGEIVLSDKMLYTSDNGYLKLELKKEDRINIKSGEAILFKNKVPTNSDKKVEVVIKVFKNIDIYSDAKKLENRKNILKLLYENRKETEKNNLASVISYGKVVIGDKEYFAEVYRYYSGGDLLNKAPLKYEEIKQRIIPSLLTALRYLHSHNIVHRDIKPENIYIDANGKIYLGDFGIARYIGENNKEYDNKKFGTPGYSALELLAPSTGIVGKESDYYSLGQTLFTLYTGKMMYDSIIKRDDRNQALIEYMLYDNYIELDRLKNHKLFQALVKGLLNSSPKNRFNDTHIDKFLIEDYSLIREAKLNKEDDFSIPLNVFGKSFYSKNEIFNFLIENKDRVNEFFNNQYISRTLDKNNIPIDCKKIERIEKKYINGDVFEKKYQLFNLYKYLKNENIFIWDNKEIKDYREITSIPSDDLKKLLQKEEMYDFFRQKFNFDDKLIAIFQDIRKYYPEKIVSILNILFDPNNNNKSQEDYTYKGKNLESLIIESIKNKNFNTQLRNYYKNSNNMLVELSSLLYFNGDSELAPIEFFTALEKNVKENGIKIIIREKFLQYNTDNINESYQKLIEMISSIRNKYYEATGRESQEILDNICSCEIFIERMNINEIRKNINDFEYEYKRFEKKFEDNPYSVIKKFYPKDSIITRYYNKYIIKNINEYYNKFKTEVSKKKDKFDELKTSQKKENIMSLLLVSIISFLLAYILSMKDLYIKYIAIDNSIIKLLIPQFKYLFYTIGMYFIVKIIIFIILKLSVNYKDIEKKCTDIFNKTYGSEIADFIYTGISEKRDSKFSEDFSGVDIELDNLEKKYISINKTYEKAKKIQLFLPAFSMMLTLFLIFKNVNIFYNHYFLFKLYGYFLSLAIIYVLAIEKYLKTLFYSKKIILILSMISLAGLYFYQYSINNTIVYNLSTVETFKTFESLFIGLIILLCLNLNLRYIIEENKSYLFYSLLIPGIIIPLAILTLPINLKWYYFYPLLALPGVIGGFLYKENRAMGYLVYKIPFALLGYSLVAMTGTPMFNLGGFFNAFIMFIMGDIFAAIVVLIVFGIIAAIL